MAGSWTTDRFPKHEIALRHLAEQHRELDDEPLHLALTYLPPNRDPQHIFLFEVIGGGSNAGERDLFETVYEATPAFPMGPQEKLHLVLASVDELDAALREGWPLASEVVSALRNDDYQVLHEDEVGRQVLSDLRAAAQEVGRG